MFAAGAGTLAVAMLLSLPAPASAFSAVVFGCEELPEQRHQRFEDADVVAEGVFLSGPSFYGALLSPARFHVVRYVKGGGPRVVRIQTSQMQVATGRLGLGEEGADAEVDADPGVPRAGGAYRILARTRGRHRERRELTDPIDTCSGDDRQISIRRLLRPVPGTLVRGRLGRSSRGARLLRGRGGLRCVVLVVGGGSPGACGYPRKRTLVAMDARASSTAVALAGKGLRGFTATRLSDGARVDASARRGVALALLPGFLDRKEVVIVARYRDGATRTFGGFARRASVADPLGGPSWLAEHERAYPNMARRRACVLVWIDPVISRTGECGSTKRSPFFFAVRRNSQSSRRVTTRHTAVFGALSQAVSDVTVTGPQGPQRPAISSRGRSFIALLSGHVHFSKLTVSFVLKDGRTLSYTGRRQLNLARPLRP